VNPRRTEATEPGANPHPYAYSKKKYKILKKSSHFLQSPEETLSSGDMSRRSRGTCHQKRSTSAPALDLEVDERNPVVTP